MAEATKSKFSQKKVFDQPIATEIEPITNFYPAEEYHQNFYAKNPEQGYCQAVIDPKVAILRLKFKNLLKSPA